MSEKFDKEYQQAHGELPKRHSPEAMNEKPSDARLQELIALNEQPEYANAESYDTAAALRELQSLRKGDTVRVPREPTRAMILEGIAAYDEDGPAYGTLRDVYRAMIAAGGE